MKYTSKGAIFSPNRQYRYSLTRSWTDLFDEESAQVLYICLNPSTADDKQDDPTIRRCVGFAEREGFKVMELVNIFAIRSTDPGILKIHTDPVGPDNDEFILSAAARSEKIIIAWGNHGLVNDRHSEVLALLTDFELHCFGKNDCGCPKHPLYLSKEEELTVF